MIAALGWLGSALIVVSLMQRRAVPFRLLNQASALVLLVFNVAIGLWSMVALNVVILTVNTWQLVDLIGRPLASATAASESDLEAGAEGLPDRNDLCVADEVGAHEP